MNFYENLKCYFSFFGKIVKNFKNFLPNKHISRILGGKKVGNFLNSAFYPNNLKNKLN
jgi:hypothetical protein